MVLILLTIITLLHEEMPLIFLKKNWLCALFSSDEVESPTKNISPKIFSVFIEDKKHCVW